MLSKLIPFFVPLALLAAACGGGGDKTSGMGSAPEAVDAATSTPTTAARVPSEEGLAATTLPGSLNPLAMLSGPSLGLGTPSQDIADSLKAALLEEKDLPREFSSLGEFIYAVPSELGTVEMAARMFGTGDLEGEEFGPMVMAAAMLLPPAALSEFGDLEELSEAGLDEALASAEQFGVGLKDFRLLDASSLGDTGFGLHMSMDFGGLIEAFGGAAGETPPVSGISLDMYGFLHGQLLLMVMVMWPAGDAPGVDSRALAERMDTKADAS